MAMMQAAAVLLVLLAMQGCVAQGPQVRTHNATAATAVLQNVSAMNSTAHALRRLQLTLVDGDACAIGELQESVAKLDLVCCPAASTCPNGSPSTWWVCPSTYASYGIPNRHTFQPTLYADFNPDPVQMAARRDAPSPSLGSV